VPRVDRAARTRQTYRDDAPRSLGHFRYRNRRVWVPQFRKVKANADPEATSTLHARCIPKSPPR
jgi:hypothetical protein